MLSCQIESPGLLPRSTLHRVVVCGRPGDRGIEITRKLTTTPVNGTSLQEKAPIASMTIRRPKAAASASFNAVEIQDFCSPIAHATLRRATRKCFIMPTRAGLFCLAASDRQSSINNSSCSRAPIDGLTRAACEKPAPVAVAIFGRLRRRRPAFFRNLVFSLAATCWCFFVHSSPG